MQRDTREIISERSHLSTKKKECTRRPRCNAFFATLRKINSELGYEDWSVTDGRLFREVKMEGKGNRHDYAYYLLFDDPAIKPRLARRCAPYQLGRKTEKSKSRHKFVMTASTEALFREINTKFREYRNKSDGEIDAMWKIFDACKLGPLRRLSDKLFEGEMTPRQDPVIVELKNELEETKKAKRELQVELADAGKELTKRVKMSECCDPFCDSKATSWFCGSGHGCCDEHAMEATDNFAVGNTDLRCSWCDPCTHERCESNISPIEVNKTLKRVDNDNERQLEVMMKVGQMSVDQLVAEKVEERMQEKSYIDVAHELKNLTPCCRRPFQLEHGCLSVYCDDCKAMFCSVCMSEEHLVKHGEGPGRVNRQIASRVSHVNTSNCLKKFFNMRKEEGYYVKDIGEKAEERFVMHNRRLLIHKLILKCKRMVDRCEHLPLISTN